MSETKANIKARLARHAKIQKEFTASSAAYTPAIPRGSFFRLVTDKVNRVFRLPGDNPIAMQILRRSLAITVAFLILTPLVPFYQYTQGNTLAEGEFGVIDMTDSDAPAADTDYVLQDVMTEDGFLLKPSLNTTEGDRSAFNEIFAYTVQPGDTLSSIASQFGLKKDTLVWENDLWNVNALKVGSTLRILPVDGVSHVVKKGDTLDKIAKQYKVDKDLLAKQNQIENGSLVADARLIVPGGTKAMPSAPVKGGAAYLKGRGSSGTAPDGAISNYSGSVAVGKLLWPTAAGARLTQGFHRGHYALDIANRNHGPIYAAAAGKVVTASYGWNGGYGNYVIIDHGNGMQTLYGHNEKLYVTPGQYVEQGQTISWMGNSGRVYGATGIHVHFEVRINGVKYNPMQFF